MRATEDLIAQYVALRKEIRAQEAELAARRYAAAKLKQTLKRRGVPLPKDDLPYVGGNLRPRPKTRSELGMPPLDIGGE